jgi:hypothetical protein
MLLHTANVTLLAVCMALCIAHCADTQGTAGDHLLLCTAVRLLTLQPLAQFLSLSANPCDVDFVILIHRLSGLRSWMCSLYASAQLEQAK